MVKQRANTIRILAEAEIRLELEQFSNSFNYGQAIKSKELEIGLDNQLTYCVKTVMREVRNSSKSIELKDV